MLIVNFWGRIFRVIAPCIRQRKMRVGFNDEYRYQVIFGGKAIWRDRSGVNPSQKRLYRRGDGSKRASVSVNIPAWQCGWQAGVKKHRHIIAQGELHEKAEVQRLPACLPACLLR